MKKNILLCVIALTAITMNAQDVVRLGNKYYVDGALLGKDSFSVYMQNNAEKNLALEFQKGSRISGAGWGMFGVGLATSFVALCASVANLNSIMKNPSTNISNTTWVTGVSIGGCCVALIGCICLGAGYSKMHNAADAYIHSINKPQAYLSIQTSENGLGLALNF